MVVFGERHHLPFTLPYTHDHAGTVLFFQSNHPHFSTDL